MPAKRKRVKRTREYVSPQREEGALETRHRILDVARALFIARGYAGLKMQTIADRAKVALDTVYATLGRKSQLVRLLVETAISNSDQAVPAEQREYVQRIRAADNAREKLAIYAAAAVAIQGRLAPIARALSGAADPALAKMWREISERRANNMKLFAADLLVTREVRPGLAVEHIADVLWATNGPEMYTMLVEDRGWSPAQLESWLVDSWSRLLLA